MDELDELLENTGDKCLELQELDMTKRDRELTEIEKQRYRQLDEEIIKDHEYSLVLMLEEYRKKYKKPE